MVDIDGVISLFGFGGAAGRPFDAWAPALAARGAAANDGARDERDQPAGSLHTIEGTPHFLSHGAAIHLLELREQFELVWASGWEEKAGEHLPHLLGLPADMPFLRFERGAGGIGSTGAGSTGAGSTGAGSTGAGSTGAGSTGAHWKLAAIERHASGRALAWVDDSFNDACHEWAARRYAPTLLVQTQPARGLTAREASLLTSWALGLGRA